MPAQWFYNPSGLLFLLAFEDQGEYDHPRFEFVDHVGILQTGITAMYILDAFADLEFGRKDKDREIELKAETAFDAEICRRQFHQVLRFSGGRIGGEIVLIVESPQHVDPEIIDPVAEELHMSRETEQK